jgi:hypothetical protein
LRSNQRLGALSAVLNAPELVLMTSHAEQAVAWIVPLAAGGTGNKAADVHALAIVFFGHGEGGATAARDEEHARAAFLFALVRFRHELSSTTARALFFRLLACNAFFRNRRFFGVISTNSSSAMNSIACSRFIWR